MSLNHSRARVACRVRFCLERIGGQGLEEFFQPVEIREVTTIRASRFSY